MFTQSELNYILIPFLKYLLNTKSIYPRCMAVAKNRESSPFSKRCRCFEHVISDGSWNNNSTRIRWTNLKYIHISWYTFCTYTREIFNKLNLDIYYKTSKQKVTY